MGSGAGETVVYLLSCYFHLENDDSVAEPVDAVDAVDDDADFFAFVID